MRNIKVEEPRALREAREEITVEIALNCLKQNIPVEAIAQATGLTIAQLQELQAQLK
jgi:predicted transposase YdaD